MFKQYEFGGRQSPSTLEEWSPRSKNDVEGSSRVVVPVSGRCHAAVNKSNKRERCGMLVPGVVAGGALGHYFCWYHIENTGSDTAPGDDVVQTKTR